MTDTNNGWPGKPGVPLNPEKDGWHWLRTPDGELVPYNWRPEGECERGSWAFGWVYDIEYDWPPVECTYLGPVLSHDDATAMQARVAELEGLAWGLMLAMSASRYDFAEILKEARAVLEGKKA
jgi:hypothetical protein